ncbi:MAG: carbohydrate ABC transporter permease [SAR324 cluster bacterium]|jgi:multiple sugar transport system permease protein|nr:ABC transporter permease [Pseudomonadota bacterium]MDP6094054.1 carbohydrate ABC transporter permease [SAR324 cluster bacterium]MEE1577271.1 carbohydrate ABC transporter permease [Deltaproteobacteria bacterium]MDP6248124.1 carbohydrate ABC transporter permease [SAR324 cluster bacterium]MDP6465675.1 carbohydrate ABC transporter permease [SAR324 cluster bacterium]|tara:strand:+ start:3190 stop:4023 length:834 start_codon:yes stop_codon:yes gene_type:complete
MIFSQSTKKQILDLLQFLMILLAASVILVPIYWIVSGAFKKQVDIFQLKLLFTPTLENFQIIFQDPYDLQEKLLNSTLVAFFTVVIAIPLATMAAYSFSRFRLKGERFMFVTILATQFVPAVVIVLPFFILFRDLGILDTRLALVLVNLSLIMPFAIWMIKGFIDSIPLDTEEAALVDGSSRIQVIINVVVPMVLPGVITAGIFCFILSWNEFLFAVIITTNKAVTLPVGLSMFHAEEGVLWNLISAAGIIIMMPMFVLATLIQRHFVQGMTMGAVR